MKYLISLLFIALPTITCAKSTWYNDEDVKHMTEALYFESRGEPLRCQVLVGYTILNRVKKRGLTVKQVVEQPSQFSYEWDGKPEIMFNKDAAAVARSLTILILEGSLPDLTEGGEFFVNLNKVPNWKFRKVFTKTTTCSGHTFFKE